MTGTAYHSSPPGVGDLMAGRQAGRHMDRTETPVWRNSYDVEDERVLRYPHAVDEAEMGAFMSAAEEYSRQTKGPGKRCGALRTHGVAILRYLWQESKRNKGLCCPSHKQIAAAVNIAISTVKATIDDLYKAGFIEWIRRTINDDTDGPPKKQAPNLYRFLLPKAVAWRVSKYMVRKFGRKPGLPRSIAAALSDADLAVRSIALMHSRIQLQRKPRSFFDRFSSVIQHPIPSPLNGLS